MLEQHSLDFRRRLTFRLSRSQKTQARIEHMLKNGKPLRN